ncbi:MAG: type I methionyl aminopeptidase [Chlamydiota bacterium]|nr:type I methionyl aminopeptidase [Chlamydiota bacterium]
MIFVKSEAEIEKMRVAGRVTAKLMDVISRMIKPGVTGLDLEKRAERFIVEEAVKPAFKGYMGYSSCLCISLNNAVVHGIPNAKAFREGDIVSIDMGIICDGFYGDMARTFAVGEIDESKKRLIDVTHESLMKATDCVQEGHQIGDLSHAVESWVLSNGYSVVKDFVGHGIGRKLHEDPPIPNFGSPHTGPNIKAGMVFAIEPMVNMGQEHVKVLSDGWTVVTKDGSLSAHSENTVAVTENGPEILTRI